jgi:hypothetical protein
MDEAGRLNMECTAKDAAIKWVERHTAANTTETRREDGFPTWLIITYVVAAALVLFFYFLSKRK